LTNPRHIVIGDVHGCRAELERLLGEVDPQPGDTVVFSGDLVSRGPDSLGVVRVARALAEREGMTVVLVAGNNEAKLAKSRAKVAAGKEVKGLRKRALAEGLSVEDAAFLDSAVLCHRIEEHNLVVVHAGVSPAIAHLPKNGTRIAGLKGSTKRLYESLYKLRWVDIEGYNVAKSKVDPSIHFHWTEAYDGRFGRVVYGHEAYVDDSTPREGFAHSSVGIDLGCVFGGRLAALVVDSDGTESTVTVKAFTSYSRRERRPQVEGVGEAKAA
jgi:serine/threonine protein phosphatase 1